MRGKLVHLRALEPEDIAVLYEWENDPEVWKISNTLTPFSKYLLKRYIETSHLDVYVTKQLRFIITLNENQKPVGAIDLYDFDMYHQRAGVGILIYNRNDRGQGYASEALELLIEYAFTTLGLHQLFCNVTADNASSLTLFKNKGFEETCCKKQWLRTSSGWQDEIKLQLINGKQN